jgi:hypothetical protein
MAANTKRIPVKWIRDGAKSAYNKQDTCFICDTSDELELHHTHGMTNLLETWAKANGISLKTDEEVLEIRDRFIEEHHKEIYEDVYTLCVKHHRNLHTVYGKSPALSTATKQENWIKKQKDKHNGVVNEKPEPSELVQQRRESKSSPEHNSPERGIFSKFLDGNVDFSSFRSDRVS